MDDKITGNYCAIYNNGKRIDCIEDDKKNINGTFVNGIWEIDYISSYSMKKGKATIEFNEESNTLQWENLTTENGAICPQIAIMKK